MDGSPQAPLSMGFFLAKILESGLPFPSPGDLPDPGIKPISPALQADWQVLYRLSHQKGSTDAVLPKCTF